MQKRKRDPEAAIRKRAERMWKQDGSPPGRFDEYLERARELQAIIDNPTAGELPNPIVEHHGEIPPPEPVEEAEIQENLGEFPAGTLTDQGDRLQFPLPKKKARKLLRES